MSAAIWKTIEQRVVAHYGMLEEFVSLVTDIVPDILTVDQRAQLTLGLRARVRRIIVDDQFPKLYWFIPLELLCVNILVFLCGFLFFPLVFYVSVVLKHVHLLFS